MVKYTISRKPDPEKLLTRFDEAGKTSMRYEDFVENDSVWARRTLDELVLEGKVARFPVGDHIMVRDLRGDPTREKGWPHGDHVKDVSTVESPENDRTPR